MQNQTDLYSYNSCSAVDFIIGLFITLGASLLNALGLNVTKLDFTRQEALPVSARKPDWKRPFWVLGLGLYIVSQVVGSTLALNYLRAEYVAPLGSLSLVFNFVFAYLLVGTSVTRLDILGTIVVILGVVGVVVFGNNRHIPEGSFDKESNLSLSVLKSIWSREDWIVYLIFLEVATVLLFWISTISHEVCMARIVDDRGEAGLNVDSAIDDMVGRGGRRVSIPPTAWAKIKESAAHSHGFARRFMKRQLERFTQSKPESVIRRLAGFNWSVTAGVLAGQSLVFAKSGIKLLTIGFANQAGVENPFKSFLTYIILVLLIASAVAQVYCLNKALKCCDSTLSVPVLFATYTTCGFINNLVYLDQFDSYKTWVFALIWVSIIVLISGVVLLSLKKTDSSIKSPNHQRNRSILQGGGLPTTNQDADSTGFEVEMQDSKLKDVILTTLASDGPGLRNGGKRQGSLGAMFGGKVDEAPQEVLEVVVDGEMSRKERRKRAQRLDDGDDEDEVDRLGWDAKGTTKSGEEEFGEFEGARR